MTTYRIERRFVLRAVGFNMVLAGLGAALAYLLAAGGAPTAPVVGAAVLAIALVSNAAALFAVPPAVVRVDDARIRVGGRLTVKPFEVAWGEVETVSSGDGRAYLERGEDDAVVIPLAYVGRRRDELVRDLYDRLNEANGYRRL